VSVVCCPSSDLCDGLIPRPGESYRLCHCVLSGATVTLYTYDESVEETELRNIHVIWAPKTTVWYENASSTYMMIIARQC
jgi:hypothetical protein